MFPKENDKIKVVLCANAGISITTPFARIWVDALHDQHEETFSDVTPAMWETMKKHPDFRDPDVLVFTHRHDDHYSAGLLGEAMRLYPTAKVILPPAENTSGHSKGVEENTSGHSGGAIEHTSGHSGGAVEHTSGHSGGMVENASRHLESAAKSAGAALQGTAETVREFYLCPDLPDGDVIYTIRTLHEGKAFTDVPHDAILLETCGKRILFTGDMRIDRENAQRLAAEVSSLGTWQSLEDAKTGADFGANVEGGERYLFDAVFAAFPWETTTKGRTILREVLRPRQTVLYHIPFKEDDLFGYRKGVEKALTRGTEEENVSALMEPFEAIVL